MNQAVDKLDSELKEVNNEIKNATANERVRWEKRKTELEEEREELQASLRNIKNETQENWSQFKKNVRVQLDKIDRDLEN